MRESAAVELLADELRNLTGWGVENPGRLARTLVLSELAQIDPSLSPTTAGCVIRRYLVEAVRSFEGSREFLGRSYDAQTLQRAFVLSLGLAQAHLSAPIRQYRVVKLLGLAYSYDQWRKSPRLQRGLLTLLAEWMMSRHLSSER